MKFPSLGTIGGIALMGGIGYVVYKFYKGDWKLPSLGDIGGSIGGTIVNVLPGEPEITAGETGLPGATGDIIYNLFSQESLRERAEEAYPGAYEETKQLIDITTPPGITPPEPSPAGVFSRSVAKTTAEDIHGWGPLAYLIPGLSAVTIGAGLGAAQRQADWRGTLPKAAQEEALRRESVTRITKVTTDPSTMLAAALSLPIVTVPMLALDLFRIATTPTPKKAAAPAAPAAPRPPPEVPLMQIAPPAAKTTPFIQYLISRR